MHKVERIIAEIQNMARAEILSLISEKEYERIKNIDNEPEFRVYAIAHEGTAEGKIIGAGYAKQNWFRTAIKKLAEKIQEGIKFFHMHSATSNSTENRQPLGEVVGKGVQEIGKKLYALVAAYIYPEFRDMPLDIASIEADIVYSKESGKVKIDDVKDVTGIALGNSAVISPGFAGATLLGCVQAFAKQKSSGKKGDTMTKAEVKELRKQIEEGEVKPSDLFSEDELTQDPGVQGMISKAEKKAVTGEYEHRKRTDAAFDKARADWDKEKKALEDKNKELSTSNAKFKVGDVFAGLAKDRKLDEKQVAFINKNIGRFEVKEAEKVKEEMDTFVTAQLKEYDEFSEIVTGKKPEDNKSEKKPGEKGTGSGDDTPPETNEEYEDVKKNDFIPE